MEKKVKKLVLSRETVRKLTESEAGQVVGGSLGTLSRETKVCCEISFTHCSACCP
jgi:hypothetical protein